MIIKLLAMNLQLTTIRRDIKPWHKYTESENAAAFNCFDLEFRRKGKMCLLSHRIENMTDQEDWNSVEFVPRSSCKNRDSQQDRWLWKCPQTIDGMA